MPKKARAKKVPSKVRDVLVILSNRLDTFHKLKFFELKADDTGNILKQRKLSAVPAKAIYDEVWENDEGRAELESCNRFKRRYGHKWQRKR